MSEPTGATSKPPFLIGIDGHGPLHAVESRRADSPRRAVPTVCGTRAEVARTWGGFARGNYRVDTMPLCPVCRWHVAISTDTTAAELAMLTPTDAEQQAMARAQVDPLMFVRLCERLLTMGRENDSDIEPWTQVLGHVTRHRPVLLRDLDCLEKACGHDTVQDCYGETPTVACESCSLRQGSWAGEMEGWFVASAVAPCSALVAVEAHYASKAVAS